MVLSTDQQSSRQVFRTRDWRIREAVLAAADRRETPVTQPLRSGDGALRREHGNAVCTMDPASAARIPAWRRRGRDLHRSRAARYRDRRPHGREGRRARRRIPRSACSTGWRVSSPRASIPAAIEFFAHGTTITTNALLEMRGAKVGLLITKGFRAVQEVQNQARDGNLFDYFYAKPQPIAPQSLTKEIPERSDYAGNVLAPARSRGGAPSRARAESRGRRVDRGLLPVLVHEPGARGARRAR